LRLPALIEANWHGNPDNTVRAEVGDGNVGGVTQNCGSRGPNTIGANHTDTVQTERVWRCCGGFLPLDGTVSLLRSDAVVVPLTRQNLAASVVVALHTAGHAGEVLDTVSGSFVGSSARNLPGKNIESLGSGGGAISVGYGDCVR